MSKKFDKLLNDWSDEECLTNFTKFLDRVGLSTQFIETEEGLLTHQLLAIQCGESIIVSDPEELEWPLQRMPMPEALKGALN